MKVRFDIYARRPLGRLLGEILDRLERFSATRPVAITLSSRHGRTDLPREELLRTAATSPFDVCTIDTAGGEVIAVWRYGPGASVPAVFGRLDVAPGALPGLRECLADLSAQVGASYGVCDLDSAAFTPPDGIDTYVSQGIFFDLFWWNYFGPEYSSWTTANGPIASLVARPSGHPPGAVVVETRQAPTSLIDTKVVGGVVAQWPVFLRWNPGAARVAAIDYWEVRRLAAAPQPVDRKVADFVGPADAFIASVSESSRRFTEWAVANGSEPKTEEEFRQLFREKYAVILDQYLVAAIAAYGEAVRQKIGGEWAKAWLFGRGEPVVGRRGRPWSRRRVIFEALEALQAPSVNSR